jgi:hypothetical protein
MSWIKDDRRPEIVESFDDWEKSKRVLVLIKGGEVLVAEFNNGIEEGEYWEQWYSPVFEDTIENVIGWSDCIPNINN